MKDENIRKLWELFSNDDRYKKYIQLPSMLERFIINLNKVKNYIDENNKRPSNSSKKKEIQSMAMWIGTCQKKYKKKEDK